MSKQLTDLVEGDVVAINKPFGMSSHDVIYRVRKATGIKRVGHAGTLDPLATGVLLVLVGRSATKRQAEFMDKPKQYEAELTFGSVTESRDAEGEKHQTATLEELAALDQSAIEKVLPQFTGTIQQRPPAYSAIKVDGQPLYKKAREGKITNEEIPAREVTIDSIEILSFVPVVPPFPPTVRLRINCQKGVYIRSLAHDIGQVLGVGSYMSALVRTAVGEYTLETTIDLP